jgi:uncharacterized RDD family membrane protein YckC
VKILIQQEYKGIAVRLGAQVIDWIILGIIYFIIGYVLFGTVSWQVTGAAALPVIMINAIIVILYYVVLEGTNGATLGKKLLKIKVVKEDGNPCGLGAAFVRNLLRIIDGLPFLYIIGMILIARSPKKQRLGDRVAHTVVVGASSTATSYPQPYPQTSYQPPSPEATTTTETKFCINCGNRIPVHATFCPKCGSKTT